MRDYNIEPYNEQDSRKDYEQEEAYLRAKKRVDNIVGFYWHLAAYLIVNIFLLVISFRANGSNLWGFQTFSTPFFWGIGLFFHFLRVFVKGSLFSKAWEDKKIAKFMDDDKKRWE